MSKQEIITKADADVEVGERKALGLENRLNERHQLRMQWYRARPIRQAVGLASSAIVFVSVTYVAVNYGWFIAAVAAVCGGSLLVTQAIINAASQPPEDRGSP